MDDRTRGTGCPQCSGRKVCKHNCLATKSQKVAPQRDYKENHGTPDTVLAQGSQPVSWLCDACGHTSGCKNPILRVVKGRRGCPMCAEKARGTTGSSTQYLQSARTLKGELALQSGTMSARHFRETSQTILLCESNKPTYGFAPSAQQGSVTAGLHGLINGWAA